MIIPEIKYLNLYSLRVSSFHLTFLNSLNYLHAFRLVIDEGEEWGDVETNEIHEV